MLFALRPHIRPVIGFGWKHPFVSSLKRTQITRVVGDTKCRVALCLVLLCVSAYGWAQDDSEDARVLFDIPKQRADHALTEFAEQADLTLMVPHDLVRDKAANALIGEYSLEEGADILLAGTGLNPEFSNKLVMSISIDDKSANKGDDMNVKKKAGLLAALAAVFTGANAQDPAVTDVPDPQLEEIVVVGTHIRGIEVVGADVITLDREYIELSGIASTTELIQSMPQNFGLGNEAGEWNAVASESGLNYGFSPSVNLRGLGSDSTLMLLNGRRSASGGDAGNFVDLNTIPTTAIERIDILADGASAIYGSDAVGGVVNVVLRDDYDGAETRIRYAPGTSDIDEIQFNQMFGKSWDSGNILFSYEYYDRSELKSADREYTRNSDLSSLGGGNYSTTSSNPGNILDPSTFQPGWAIPTGQDGTGLTPVDLIDLSPVTGNPDAVNLQNIREGSYVLPKQERHSVFLSASQALSKTVDVFAEIRYSIRDFEFLFQDFGGFLVVPSTNAFFVDPVGGSQSLFYQYSFVDDFGPSRGVGDVESLGGVLGATFSVGDSWELELYGSHGSEDTFRLSTGIPNREFMAVALADPDPATAFNPFADGSNTNPATLATIEGWATIDIESELTTFNVIAEGDLFNMPGGTAKLAIGGEIRNQSLSSNFIDGITTSEPILGSALAIYNLDRDIGAAFAEVYLPFVTDQNSRPGIKNLAVSISGRYEDYSDFGDTFNPKLGLSWSPVESLKFRSTVGTSFRAPLLTELNTNNNFYQTRNRVDPTPADPSNRTLALTLRGNSPDLIPQEGETWTAGFDLVPDALPGLEIGLTYFDTTVENVIRRPDAVAATVFLDPGLAPIIRYVDTINNPDDLADVVALLNDPFCTHSSCATPPDQIEAIVDTRVQNVAKADLSGLDLSVAYAFETSAGAFDLSLYASYLFDFKQQLLNGPAIDKVDTIANPNSLNLRSSLSWNSGGMHATVTAIHIGDYIDNLGSLDCSLTPCPVRSWTTWDLQLGYDFGDRSGFLNDTRLWLTVQNVLDKDPPFVDVATSAVGFDAINANPMGRFASLQLIKGW